MSIGKFDDVEIINVSASKGSLSTAEERFLDSKTDDQKKLTELKESFAGAIVFFLWFWFGALCLLITTYVSHQMLLKNEIPKEVIISAFTSTAVVVGLVGYILKGLFGGGK